MLRIPTLTTFLLPLVLSGSLAAQEQDFANLRLKKLISYPETLAYKPDVVTVAVIDTGVSLPSAFKDQVLAGLNVVHPNQDASDQQGHGTAVAGIILGIAPNARILPVMVADQGVGTTEGLIEGIVYAVREGAEIINLSIGVTDLVWDKVTAVVGAEKMRQVFFVVAAGNSGDRYISARRAPDNLILVGATNLDKARLASYSVWGTKVQIAAPAGSASDGIWTYKVSPDGELRKFNGTSGATPVVAGAAALLKSQKKNLTPVEIKEALLDSSCEIPQLKRWIDHGRLLNVGRLLNQPSTCPK